MNKYSLLSFSWLLLVPACAFSATPLSRYSVVYSSLAEPEEGLEIAQYLNHTIGKRLPVFTEASAPKGYILSITNSQRAKGIPTPPHPFDWTITSQNGNIIIDGGGAWAMKDAVRALAAKVTRGQLPRNFSLSGTVSGRCIFPRGEGVNLRILDDNIWDYSSEKIPEAWQKIGVDPRDSKRGPEFAQLVRSYMPDVIALQEYSAHMHKVFYPFIQQWGYAISYESTAPWNNTPVFYNSSVLKLLGSKYMLYTPECWSNGGTKSFTSAVFEHKTSGSIFAVISTHLWWKDDISQPGSTMARASQVRLVMAEAELIKAQYDCPIFVMGDMNCEENTIPINQFLQGGYQPCYRIATEYANHDNGHHQTFPDIGFSRKSNRLSAERSKGAIDHVFLYNAASKCEVKVFDCIQAEFIVKLTDHYPNLVDARLIR